MTRWEPDAGGRLQAAAMELFHERGYEQTTVAEIADRAGLTKRTFFRHFTDKREVLFGGSERFEQAFVDGLAAAPASAAPLEAVAATLESVGAWFESFRDHGHSRRRQALITANPSLQERELVKLDSIAAVLAAGLRERGVPEPDASVAAQAGMAVFRVAFDRWATTADDDATLPDALRAAMRTLQAVTAGRR